MSCLSHGHGASRDNLAGQQLMECNANCQLPLAPAAAARGSLNDAQIYRCPMEHPSIVASLVLAAQHLLQQLADKCSALDNGPLRFAVDNAIQGEPGQSIVDDGIEAAPADGFPWNPDKQNSLEASSLRTNRALGMSL